MSELRIFFNEYFERKPSRLNERQDEKLFTLEPTDVNNFEFMTVEEHEKEIQFLKAMILEARKVLNYSAGDSNVQFALEQQWLTKTENIRVEE